MAVAEATGRSAGRQYGETIASIEAAIKSLHLDELESRINNSKEDPARIRTFVEDMTKVRGRMQAELNEAAARFPQFRDATMQRAAEAAFEAEANESYVAARFRIAMRNAFLDAVGGILAAAAERLGMSALKVATQGARQVTRAVSPPGPAQPRAPIYEPKLGPHHPEPPRYGGLVPPKPGELAVMRGFQNEVEVARITGGTLARNTSKIGKEAVVTDLVVKFTLPNGQQGRAAVDVLGPNKELIVVGGPAKGADLAKLGSRLTDLKRAGDATGVQALAYFTSDTPEDVLDLARRKLGPDNVKLFARPAYKQP
jgi:hypothetical protein